MQTGQLHAGRGVPYTFGGLEVWEIIFVLVLLKIPIAYVGWVMWWAIKAEPEIGTEGGTEGPNWQPWRRPADRLAGALPPWRARACARARP